MGFWDFLRRKKKITPVSQSDIEKHPAKRWRYGADGVTKYQID